MLKMFLQLSVYKIRDPLHSPHTFKGVIASELEVLSWDCDFYGTKARLTHSLVRCPFPPPYSGSFYHRNYQYITNGDRKRTDVFPSAQRKPEEIEIEKTNVRGRCLNNKRIVWSFHLVTDDNADNVYLYDIKCVSADTFTVTFIFLTYITFYMLMHVEIHVKSILKGRVNKIGVETPPMAISHLVGPWSFFFFKTKSSIHVIGVVTIVVISSTQ